MSTPTHRHTPRIRGVKTSIQITVDQVRDVLYSNNGPMTMMEIGKSLNVHPNCVSNIVRGRTGTFNVKPDPERGTTVVDISESLKAYKPGWGK